MALNAAVATEKKIFTSYDLMVILNDCKIAKSFELKTSTFAVLNKLARHYNPNTNVMYPGIETIADNINASVATVKRAIKELKTKGLILVSQNKKNNVYSFGNTFWNFIAQFDTNKKQSEQVKYQIDTQSSIKLIPKHNKKLINKKHNDIANSKQEKNNQIKKRNFNDSTTIPQRFHNFPQQLHNEFRLKNSDEIISFEDMRTQSSAKSNPGCNNHC